jgi:hypothetical protein
MGNKKCKDLKKEDFDPKQNEKDKYKCKKCNLTANKEKNLCKAVKR